MTSAIEVIGPVPATAAYLCWVQRSIDRTGVFDMRIDGADTSGYRKAVASFKTAESLPRDDRVDIATQNRLIRIIHANRPYTAWVLSEMRMAAGAACSQHAAVAAKHLFVLRDIDRIEVRTLLDVPVSLG